MGSNTSHLVQHLPQEPQAIKEEKQPEQEDLEILKGQQKVFTKICSCPIFHEILNNDAILQKYIKCLSDPKQMLQTYLNLDHIISKQWDEYLKIEEEQLKIKKNKEMQQRAFTPHFYNFICDKSQPYNFTINTQPKNPTLQRLKQEEGGTPIINPPPISVNNNIILTPSKRLTFEENKENIENENVIDVFEELTNAPTPKTPNFHKDCKSPKSPNLIIPKTPTSTKKGIFQYSPATPINNNCQEIIDNLTLCHLSENVSNQIDSHLTNEPYEMSPDFIKKTLEPLVEEKTNSEKKEDWWKLNPSLEKSIKIKLIITDMHHQSKTKQTLRQMISPILSPSRVLPKLGMFHTALVIGNFKIEWNDSALCIPRKIASQSTFLSADIEEITTANDLEITIKKLAEVICKWNTQYDYFEKSPSNKKKENSSNEMTSRKGGNCQDFIFDILSSLGKVHILEEMIKSKGPMGSYLREIRKYGKCSMKFKMSKDFITKFQLPTDKKVKKFTTHKELDLFVIHLLDIDNNFKENYPNEWKLLKSFDRAFWIRHLTYKENVRFRPYCKHVEELDNSFQHCCSDDSIDSVTLKEILYCPFDDPQKTLSIVVNK
ncbi:hypothetical protein ABK040_010890 [Willaertia magna]